MKNAFQVICTYLLLFLSCSWVCYGQPTELRFEHLTVNQGLSDPIVHAMIQDHHGYLWFATDNGLNKYNGYTMTTYQKIPGDTTSLVSNVIYQLLEDKEGYIWLGMAGQGICKFDPRTEKFTNYGPNPRTLSQGTIFTMGEDQEGNIWVSNWRDELRRFDKKSGAFSTINYASLLAEKRNGKLVTPIVSAICSDRKGTIWVCSERGLHRMNFTSAGSGKPSKISFTSYRHDPANPRSLSHDQVWRVFEDRSGMIWVNTDHGLDRFNPKTETFTHYQYTGNPSPTSNASINQSLKYMADDREGNLWIGTPDHGLFKLDPVRGRFTQMRSDPVNPASLSSVHIRSLFSDRSGLLWVGTWGEGVDKANPDGQSFAYYRPLPFRPHSLSYKFVSFILEDQSGTVWVGTGDGLNRMNKQTGEFTHYRHDPTNPKSLPKRNAEAMLEDRDGAMWVSSFGELARFTPKTGEFDCLTCNRNRYPGLGDNIQILKIIQDQQGLLWLGTTNGVKCFNPKTSKVIHYAYNPKDTTGISEAYARELLEDNRGNLWIGTDNKALNRLDRKTGRFTHYRPDLGKPGSIPSDGVSSIFQDCKGNLWVGTIGGGLCQFDYKTETFQTFTKAAGLADNSVFSIDEDNQGNLWLGTYKGLSCFSPKTKTFRNYEVNDGQQNNSFRRPHCKGKDGILYFGGDNGFTAFDPRRLAMNDHIPPIVITQVKLFDTPIAGLENSSTIDLDYDKNFLSFEFAALDYANPSKNQYAYQLVGLDKSWVYSGSRRYISYTDLEPGTYVFRVKGSNNDGVWNQKGASIQVTIRPPWWKTSWFRLLLSMIILSIAYASVRLYTRNRLRRQRSEMKRVLQAQEEERQRLAADLHDDLGATLSTIKGRLQRISNPSEALKISIHLMEKAIIDLRHISHHLMPPEFTRLGLTESIREIVSRAEASSAIEFLFIHYGEERRLDDEAELTIYRIAVELITNAIKHAKASHITIQLIFYPKQVFLLVEDDGQGYQTSKSEQPVGIGLRNIRSRVAYLDSKLLVDSGERGTTATLEVPL
ncbi:sensor histidine kinase [Spirosoma harenae]